MKCTAKHCTQWLGALLLLGAVGCASTPDNNPEVIPPLASPHAAPTASPLLRPTPDTAAPRMDGEARTFAWADSLTTRQPRAQRVVSTEGRLPSDPVAQSSRHARLDWYGMLALAQAAKRTGDTRYASALDAYFAAWSAVYEPRANPIDETHFHQLILAFETGEQFLTPTTHTQTLKLFRRMAEALFDPQRIRPGTERNNWQSHRIKLVAAVAFVLQDQTLIENSYAVFRRQVAANIDASGVVLDFRERDALRYVVYSLEPLLTAALIAQQHGQDWYGYQAKNGASLKSALRWLAPYADGEKTHLEFQRTKIPFDRQRAAAGVKGFSGAWQPSNATTCYQLAARLDATWVARAVQLGDAPDWVELAYPSLLIDAARAGLPALRPHAADNGTEVDDEMP